MEEKEQEQQKTPAEIMQEMRDEYDARIREKDAEIESMKAQHAAEIRDILTGKNKAVNKQQEITDRVKAAAKKIHKNLGLK